MKSLTEKMLALDILFEEENDMSGYLEYHIHWDEETGYITLSQKGLFKCIIEALHLSNDTVTADTPATAFLPLDENGPGLTGLYNYASVAEMLQYLQLTTRPDLSFLVSQVCRYIFAPKRSHELALERIDLYLKSTSENGLILKPKNTNNAEVCNIDVYVDSDFASGWGTEEGTNPDSVKSRTGYIVEIMGCPIIWCSKLQTCIATSTMEAEYTALSMALRAAIPLLYITSSINKGLKFFAPNKILFKATVHEDNMGALKLAKLEPGRHTP